jgi:hypothetical protein
VAVADFGADPDWSVKPFGGNQIQAAGQKAPVI